MPKDNANLTIVLHSEMPAANATTKPPASAAAQMKAIWSGDNRRIGIKDRISPEESYGWATAVRHL